MEDKFIKWKPIEIDNDLWKDVVFLNQIKSSKEFSINFLVNNIRYNLSFGRYESFRVSDESILLEYWDILPDGYQGYPFFKVENSTFKKELQILSKDFFTGLDAEEYDHYCIFFQDECFEIITDLEPLMEKFAQ